MSSARFEAFLARLYADERFSARFIASPAAVLEEAGLDARERQAASAIDPLALQMACRSFAAKRATHRSGMWRRMAHRLRR